MDRSIIEAAADICINVSARCNTIPIELVTFAIVADGRIPTAIETVLLVWGDNYGEVPEDIARTFKYTTKLISSWYQSWISNTFG